MSWFILMTKYTIATTVTPSANENAAIIGPPSLGPLRGR